MIVRKNFSGTIGCAPFDNQMDTLKFAVQQARLVGVPPTSAKLQAALKFIDRETGISSVWIAGPSVCANLMAEADLHIKNVNAEIAKIDAEKQAAYQTPPVKPDVDAGDKILTAVKWGAVAVSLVGVIYLVGPLVRGVSKGVARRISA